jgi:hypothetical protein
MLDLVLNERLRQNALFESGVLPFNCSDIRIADSNKLPVLMEEAGEVAEALYELLWHPAGPEKRPEQFYHLRTELIQLAAVAVAWAEAITQHLPEK